MRNDPLAAISTRTTAQQSPVLGRSDQVKNNAGGYVFTVSDTTRALRFLILGTEGGTYYTSEQKLTKQNADFIIKFANANGQKLMSLILDVSLNNRAPRQNPTLFALAVCASSTDAATRQAAFLAVPLVCRTGTMMFQFCTYVQQFRGWGRGVRSAIGSWYLDKSVDKLAYQAVKYRQRDGWTHKDLIALSHPLTADPARKGLFDWIFGREAEQVPAIVEGFIKAQVAPMSDIPGLIEQYNLPWEALPDEAMNLPATWEALIPNTGLTALVRNLGRLSKIGVVAPMSAGSKAVINRLTTADEIAKSRIHPVQILFALSTYGQGQGFRGDGTWTVVPQIVAALTTAFELSFGNIVPANKRTLVALDVSGSMGSPIYNSALSAREAAAALTIPIVRTEPDYFTMGFSHQFVQLPFTAKTSLSEAISFTSHIPFGATDCALPMKWAEQNKIDVDTFVVITDNTTWSGTRHPFQALKSYRQARGIDARMAVIGCTGTPFTIADPTDSGMMDFVGFDASLPNVLNDFSRGEF